MFGMGYQELMIVGVIAILLFGKRLPEVARSLGSSYRQFRQGMSEFSGAFDVTADTHSPKKSYQKKSYNTSYDDVDDHDEATAPKFEPPPSEPTPS